MTIYLLITILNTFFFLNTLFVPFTCILITYLIILEHKNNLIAISMSLTFRSNLRSSYSWELRKIQRTKTVSTSYFNTVAGAPSCNFGKKETLANVFSCEFCAIFKNTFREHIRVAVSAFCEDFLQILVKKNLKKMFLLCSFLVFAFSAQY